MSRSRAPPVSLCVSQVPEASGREIRNLSRGVQRRMDMALIGATRLGMAVKAR